MQAGKVLLGHLCVIRMTAVRGEEALASEIVSSRVREEASASEMTPPLFGTLSVVRETPQTYAVTIICAGRERVFLHADLAETMVKLLARYRTEGRIGLHGFVVMPDHLHVLFTPTNSLEAIVGLIKGGFSFAIRKHWNGPVWQDGYYAHRVLDARDYDSQLSYISANPERWGYTRYPYRHVAHPEMIDSRPDHLGG